MGGFRERRSLICATTVCTVCEHAQPKSAKNSSHTTSAPAHEDSPRRRIVRWLSAYFLEPNSRHERCRGPWTATCQTLVDFVAKHAGTLEPLHDHGQVLAGVVIVVEALSGFVRVEDRDANHC